MAKQRRNIFGQNELVTLFVDERENHAPCTHETAKSFTLYMRIKMGSLYIRMQTALPFIFVYNIKAKMILENLTFIWKIVEEGRFSKPTD